VHKATPLLINNYTPFSVFCHWNNANLFDNLKFDSTVLPSVAGWKVCSGLTPIVGKLWRLGLGVAVTYINEGPISLLAEDIFFQIWGHNKNRPPGSLAP
jgi:hypothetical protein